jgi:di/tripeptidase
MIIIGITNLHADEEIVKIKKCEHLKFKLTVTL